MGFRAVTDGTVSISAAPALALHGITKHFENVAALHDATFLLRAGSVHALLGENGAGKTTLMRVAFGLVQPDSGTMERDGQRVSFRRPGDAIAHGIGMVHQHYSLVPDMTVAENISLGGHGRFSPTSAHDEVQRVAREFGLQLEPRIRARDLSVAGQQRVEIAKALSRNARVLILDEPTAVLAPQDAQELLATLRRLADQGTAVVLITHKLNDALAISDEITVLRAGNVVLHSSASATTPDALSTAMMGERLSPKSFATPASNGTEVLRLRNVSYSDKGVLHLQDATLTVHDGEVLGIAGVEGSGQQHLLRLLAGRLHPTTGTATLPDVVGFVPEDRHRDAMVLDFDLTENLALGKASRLPRRVDWKEMSAEAQKLLDDFNVISGGAHAPARSLSGGNQQRFVVGRELRNGITALVLENPTRGLDARAAQRVHDAIRAAAAAGAAVVIYTTDLEELLLVAHRAVVCFNHRATEVPLNAMTIGRAMIGQF